MWDEERFQDVTFYLCGFYLFLPFCVTGIHYALHSPMTSKQKSPELLKWWSHQELGVGGNFQDCPTQDCQGSPGEYTSFVCQHCIYRFVTSRRNIVFVKIFLMPISPGPSLMPSTPQEPQTANLKYQGKMLT